MAAPVCVDDDERRARIGVRHALAQRVGDPVEATRAVGVLHATEPATVYLSLHARVDGLALDDVDRVLYRDRSIIKQLAMRRTLFCFPRDLLPAAWGSASQRVLAAESARIAKDVELAGQPDGVAWLGAVRGRILAELGTAPDGLTAVEVRERVPEIDLLGVGRGRVMTNLGLSAEVMRGENTQHWRVFRPRWTLAHRWLGEQPAALTEREGYSQLVHRWLERFGPGTEDDIVWWLGATKGIVRTALADLGAVAVTTAEGPGWLLPDDPLLDGARTDVGPWAALLPVLDPSIMGWRHRAFHLGSHGPALFDRNGNAGTTAWWNGRVVGCWVQDDAGVVEVRPLERLPQDAATALRAEAARLTAWLDGVRVGTVYPSPAMRADPADLPYPVLRA